MVDRDSTKAVTYRTPVRQVPDALDEPTLEMILFKGDQYHETPAELSDPSYEVPSTYEELVDARTLHAFIASQSSVVEALAASYAETETTDYDTRYSKALGRARESYLASVMQNRQEPADVDLRIALPLLGMDGENWESLEFNVENTTKVVLDAKGKAKEGDLPATKTKAFRFFPHQIAGK
jgi:hypothetical protein